MSTYYRVEVYNYVDDCTEGGFASILYSLFRIELNMDPHYYSDDELVEAVARSYKTNFRIRQIGGLVIRLLGDLEIPEIYNADDYVCLFKPHDFVNRDLFFDLLSDFLSEYYDCYDLVCFEFELPDETIVYEDNSQVVITKSDYEKYKPEEFVYLGEDEDDDYYEDEE